MSIFYMKIIAINVLGIYYVANILWHNGLNETQRLNYYQTSPFDPSSFDS